MTFDDVVLFYSQIISWKYNHGTLPTHANIIALYNFDYSNEKNALISETNNPFSINTSYVKNQNNTYNVTFIPSESCTIYYKINGSIVTTQSSIYNKTLIIDNNAHIHYLGVNKNNQRTPTLYFKIKQPTTTYITSKPILHQIIMNIKYI